MVCAGWMVAQPNTVSQQGKPRLVGYFPQWGIYDDPHYTVKSLLSSGSAAMLDQVNYAQGFVTGGHCSVADPNADLNYVYGAGESVDGVADKPEQSFRGSMNQFAKLKKQFPRMKLVISLEGHAADFAADAQPENREAFVRSCVDLFVRGNLAPGIKVPGLFDGFDLDWEFPHAEDAANYVALLTEFRKQLNAVRPGLLLNIAVGHSPRMAGAGEGGDLTEISRLVDEVGLMSYDYTGPWSQRTGFVAPLSTTPEHRYGTVQGSVEAYLAAGVPASKLLVGVPFYGYGWRMVLEDNDGLFQEGQPIRGDRPYSRIEQMAAQSTVHREPDSQTPWLFDGDVFWTYDDAVSIRHKAEYATGQHLGGLMIWELGEDNASGTLLRSAFDGLHATGSTIRRQGSHGSDEGMRRPSLP